MSRVAENLQTNITLRTQRETERFLRENGNCRKSQHFELGKEERSKFLVHRWKNSGHQNFVFAIGDVCATIVRCFQYFSVGKHFLLHFLWVPLRTKRLLGNFFRRNSFWVTSFLSRTISFASAPKLVWMLSDWFWTGSSTKPTRNRSTQRNDFGHIYIRVTASRVGQLVAQHHWALNILGCSRNSPLCSFHFLSTGNVR